MRLSIRCLLSSSFAFYKESSSQGKKWIDEAVKCVLVENLLNKSHTLILHTKFDEKN